MRTRGSQFLIILRILGIFLGVGILVYQILSSLRGFNWAVVDNNIAINLLLALACTTFAVVLQMTAWKMVLGGFNHDLSLAEIFSGFSLSFVARLIPGTIWGYLTRGEWLNREHAVPYAITNISSIVETLGYVSANLLIVFQGLLAVKSAIYGPVFLILIAFAGWAAINFFILWNPARRLFHLEQHKILHFPLLKWMAVFFLCIAMWYCYGLGLVIFANTLNFQVTLINALEISAVYALAWFIGFIVPFIPTGLGLREYSLAILLVAQFGLIKSDASFIAIGFRILVSLAELLWIAYGLLNKTMRVVNKKITL
jgi:hypothetical protein